jgi:hypothetical protein
MRQTLECFYNYCSLFVFFSFHVILRCRKKITLCMGYEATLLQMSHEVIQYPMPTALGDKANL